MNNQSIHRCELARNTAFKRPNAAFARHCCLHLAHRGHLGNECGRAEVSSQRGCACINIMIPTVAAWSYAAAGEEASVQPSASTRAAQGTIAKTTVKAQRELLLSDFPAPSYRPIWLLHIMAFSGSLRDGFRRARPRAHLGSTRAHPG